jgi:hypothetical protein
MCGGDKVILIKTVFMAFLLKTSLDTSRPENAIHNKQFNYISKNIMIAQKDLKMQ